MMAAAQKGKDDAKTNQAKVTATPAAGTTATPAVGSKPVADPQFHQKGAHGHGHVHVHPAAAPASGT